MDYDTHDKVLFIVCAIGVAVVLADVFIWRF
jgi:hypothetical protein